MIIYSLEKNTEAIFEYKKEIDLSFGYKWLNKRLTKGRDKTVDLKRKEVNDIVGNEGCKVNFWAKCKVAKHNEPLFLL